MKKHALVYALMFTALVIAFAVFRRNPALVQTVTNAANQAATDTQKFTVNVAGYTPRDYPLPSLGGTTVNLNRYSNCSFCLRSRSQSVTPTDAIMLPNPQELITVSYIDDAKPLGGGG